MEFLHCICSGIPELRRKLWKEVLWCMPYYVGIAEYVSADN